MLKRAWLEPCGWRLGSDEPGTHYSWGNRGFLFNLANIYRGKLEDLLMLLELLLKHPAYSESMQLSQTVFRSNVIWFGFIGFVGEGGLFVCFT